MKITINNVGFGYSLSPCADSSQLFVQKEQMVLILHFVEGDVLSNFSSHTSTTI